MYTMAAQGAASACWKCVPVRDRLLSLVQGTFGAWRQIEKARLVERAVLPTLCEALAEHGLCGERNTCLTRKRCSHPLRAHLETHTTSPYQRWGHPRGKHGGQHGGRATAGRIAPGERSGGGRGGGAKSDAPPEAQQVRDQSGWTHPARLYVCIHCQERVCCHLAVFAEGLGVKCLF